MVAVREWPSRVWRVASHRVFSVASGRCRTENVAVRTNFGGLLYMKGRFEQARQELEKAVAQDPTYASARNNLGAVYGRLGRREDEIAAYRKAASLDPNSIAVPSLRSIRRP